MVFRLPRDENNLAAAVRSLGEQSDEEQDFAVPSLIVDRFGDPIRSDNPLSVRVENQKEVQDVQLTGSNTKLRSINASIQEVVPAGVTIQSTITPSAGYMITKIYSMFFQAYSMDDSNNDHTFRVHVENTLIWDEVGSLTASGENMLEFRENSMGNGVTSNPDSPDEFRRIMNNLKASEDIPIIIEYINATEADQTGNIRIFLKVVEEAVANG